MRRLTLFAVPLLALGLSPALVAQNAQAPRAMPGIADVSRVAAGTYAADAGHTLVGWRVSHFGFTDYFGQFGNVTGTLVIDPANPAAATVDVSIPIADVSTASAGLSRHLLTADFFDAANHASARFVSTAVRVDGSRAAIDGNLTIRGVTRPITLDAQLAGAGNNPFNRKVTVGFHASTTIRRSDFGINYAVPMVSDMVDLTISAAFERQE